MLDSSEAVAESEQDSGLGWGVWSLTGDYPGCTNIDGSPTCPPHGPVKPRAQSPGAAWGLLPLTDFSFFHVKSLSDSYLCFLYDCHAWRSKEYLPVLMSLV